MDDLQQPNTLEMSEKDDQEQKYKELLSQVKAAITVFRQKHAGEVPDLNDIVEMLETEEELDDESDIPKCLKMKAHYGKDPKAPVYYEDPETFSFFNPQKGAWTMDKPELLDQLNSREIEHEDIFDMILHGIMDDNDYQQLHKAGLVDPKCEQLYAKIAGMRDQYKTLEKSMEASVEEDTRPEAFLEAMEPASKLDQYGVFSMDIEESTEQVFEPGEDLLAQIMQSAMNPSSDPKLLKLIRSQIAIALNRSEEELFAGK